MRRAVALLAAVALSLAGHGLAQKVSCIPKKDCAAPVSFVPAAPDLAASIGSTLAPDDPMPIVMHLKRDKGEAFSAEVSLAPWTGPATLMLEVRITLTGSGIPTDVIGWLPIDQIPMTLFTSDANRSDIAIEYRLRISGSELPGTYATTVTFHVWDENDRGHMRDTVAQPVTVELPSFLLLRIAGVRSDPAELRFDLTDPAAYLSAIATGVPVAPTSASFDAVEVATNDPAGFVVTVSLQTVALPGTPAQGAALAANVSLFGAPVVGQQILGNGPTAGFVPVVIPSDFGLRLDGSEVPGEARFLVGYEVQARP